jgi:hypothetical protein
MCLVAAALAFVGATVSRPASAAPLTIFEATEVLMHAQGADIHLLARVFGTDAASPLGFTTTVGDTSFAYEMMAGETFRGQPVSLSGSGTFDSATNSWGWNSSGTMGGRDWTSTGSAAFSGSQLTADWVAAGSLIPLPLDVKFDITLSGTIPGDVTSKGSAQLTIDNVPVPGIKVSVTDSYKNGKFDWDFKTGSLNPMIPPFAIHTVGEVPFETGGEGQFTSTVVPEPTTVVLVGMGLAGMIARSRRRSR